MPTLLRRPPLAAWSIAMVLFWATTCVESMSWTQLGAFTPLYLKELGVAAADVPRWIAAMSSLGWLLALPLAPFWGAWADRYNRKAVIVRSAVFEAVIFIGWAFAGSPWIALGFRCLNGFVLGNTGVMLAVQASLTPRQRLGLAVGVVAAGSQAGRALGPALGAILIHYVDVRGMLLFNAGLSVVMAILLTLMVKEPDREKPVGLSVLRLLREAFGEIVAHPLIWRMFVALTLAQVALWVVTPYVPIYLARFALLAALPAVATVGIVLSGTGAAAAISAPLWGQLVDRLGHVRLLTATSLCACGGLLLAGFAGTLLWFAIALLLYSVFSVAFQTANMALLASEVSVERRGAVLGQVLFPFYVSGLVGPAIGALAFPLGQRAVFVIAALIVLTPLLLLASAPRRLA